MASITVPAAIGDAATLPRRGKPKPRRGGLRPWMVYALLVPIAVVIIVPIWSVMVASVSPLSSIQSGSLLLWPTSFHFGNFARAWKAEPFGRFYLNSVFVTIAIVVLQLTTSSLAAYAFVFVRFRLSKLLFTLVVAAMFIPLQATFVASYVLMADFHWVNSYQALIVPFAASAFGIFLLTQSFRAFPSDLIECARVDGASHVRAMWSIVLPNMKPALATLAVLNFVFHFNYFFWPLVVTTSNAYRVLPVGLTMMLSQASSGRSVPWNLMMAADLFMIVPLVLIFVVAQRVMVRGFMYAGLRR